MTASPVPLLVALVGIVGYHLAQKSVPETASPFVLIGLAYAIGLVACIAIVAVSGAEVGPTVRTAWRSAAGVGLGVLTIEAGFLLAYRAGWPLSSASLLVNVSAALVLLAIGVVTLREALSLQQWAGVAACVLGLVLLTSR